MHRMAAMSEDWLRYLRERQYSPETLETRTKLMAAFLKWCEARGVVDVENVSRAVLERYQRALFEHRKRNGKPLAATTQGRVLTTLRSFFKWLTRQHILEHNPASELELPRVGLRLPREILTAGEAEKILAQPNTADALGIRDRAMLEVLYSTGMRRMELRNLHVTDVQHELQTVHIREGKGKRDRVIPIGGSALKWVDAYAQKVRPQLSLGNDATLFLTSLGAPFHKDKLTELVRNYVKQSGVGKTGSCHLFRHSMATGMLENGADIRFIQVMLGHAQLTTTEIYTRVSIGQLRAVHRRTHPAELQQVEGHVVRNSAAGGEEPAVLLVDADELEDDELSEME